MSSFTAILNAEHINISSFCFFFFFFFHYVESKPAVDAFVFSSTTKIFALLPLSTQLDTLGTSEALRKPNKAEE